jgi:hypothetical protein
VERRTGRPLRQRVCSVAVRSVRSVASQQLASSRHHRCPTAAPPLHAHAQRHRTASGHASAPATALAARPSPLTFPLRRRRVGTSISLVCQPCWPLASQSVIRRLPSALRHPPAPVRPHPSRRAALSCLSPALVVRLFPRPWRNKPLKFPSLPCSSSLSLCSIAIRVCRPLLPLASR